MKMISVKEKQKTVSKDLKEKSGTRNLLATPRLVKIVVSVGTGSSKDKNKNEFVVGRLAKITGQRPALRGAKKSIATFKVRQGDKVGVTATLRGGKMFDFLDKLINVAIPRMRDFRGLSKNGIDEIGNYTIGIKEHTIFPEAADEDLKDVFGMSITIVTTAKTRSEAEAFFESIGIPFKQK